MKTYEYLKCRRLALGLSQAGLAEICGIVPSTISNFEQGKEVSTIVFNAIKYGLEKQFRALAPIDYYEKELLVQVYTLAYKTDEEKMKTLNFITVDIGKYGLELYKKVSEQEK